MSRLCSAHLEASLGPKPVGVPTNNQGADDRDLVASAEVRTRLVI